MNSAAAAEPDHAVGTPTRRAENDWAQATAGFIRDFLRACPNPDYAELGHTLRERDVELCRGAPQPAQVSMAHVMHAIGAAGVSVVDGVHILAAYLAEERGPFSETRMLDGLKVIGADTQAPSFQAAVKSAAQGHRTKDAFMWVAISLRLWLDEPQVLAEAVKNHDEAH